jgi:quercetin dioxygenase-like cupin family protein
MKRPHGILLAALAAAFLSACSTTAPKRVTPGKLEWKAEAARPDLKVAVVDGDPESSGPYVARYRLPAGTKLPPHRHPESRRVTVLEGTLWFAYGEKFDAAALKPLPPGSWFTEPAGVVHYAWTREGAVLLQVEGEGPTGTTRMDAGAKR